jgi:hypothetical protein
MKSLDNAKRQNICSLERLGDSHLTFGEGGMFVFFLNRTWPAFYISGLFVYILNDLHM